MVALLLRFFNVLRFFPLPALRALGTGAGLLLYVLHRGRRHTVRVNLAFCFPEWSATEREKNVREVFVYFVQSWLDRIWLWYASKQILDTRLQVTYLPGATPFDDEPTVIFAPHFSGLDVGWTVLNVVLEKRSTLIYAKQKNAALDAWVKTGRERSNTTQKARVIEHLSSVRAAVQMMRKGEPLYLLPDMNYEPDDSFFIPFFGNIAATLPILPRYAKLAKAKVVPMVTRMTKSGYETLIYPAWNNYPSGDTDSDLEADSLRMNRELEEWVRAMPTQYYWVHRRFKDQPRRADGNGGPNPYDDPEGYRAAAPKPVKNR